MQRFVSLYQSRIFHLYGDATVTGEGLQSLTNERHSLPLSSKASSACHSYCDTGHPFIMVIYTDPWLHTYYRALSSGAVTTCFYDLGMSRLGFEHPTFRLRGQCSNPLRHRVGHLQGCCIVYIFVYITKTVCYLISNDIFVYIDH